jgi:hypothetical protein
MNKLVYLIGSNGAAITISGLSVMLYYVSTTGQPVYIRICSIGTNFSIGWFTGKKAVDYFKEKLGTARKISVKNCSILGSLTRGLIVATSAITTSIPFGVATYTLTNGSIAKKIGITSVQVAGMTLFNSYAIEQLIEKDGRILRGFLNEMLVFTKLKLFLCKDLYVRRKNLKIIKRSFVSSLKAAVLQIEQGNIESCNFDVSLENTLAKNLIEFIAKNNSFITPSKKTSSSSWGSLCSYMNKFSRFGLSMLGGAAVSLSALGYACNTKNSFEKLNISENVSWLLSNCVMFPVYYLGFKGGKAVVESIYDNIYSILHCQAFKPLLWRIHNKYGFLAISTAIVFSILLAGGSGYTASMLFSEECPSSWQAPGLNYLIFSGIDIYNAIYTYYALCAGLIGMKYNCGEKKAQTYLALIPILKKIIERLEDLNEDDFFNLLSEIDKNSIEADNIDSMNQKNFTADIEADLPASNTEMGNIFKFFPDKEAQAALSKYGFFVSKKSARPIDEEATNDKPAPLPYRKMNLH